MLQQLPVPRDEVHVSVEVATRHHLAAGSVSQGREHDHINQMAEFWPIDGFENAEVTGMGTGVASD